ncbi:hypothetical protein A5716_16660 [Mycolicibacterium conceptionense]|nr:hypothetical protein A5716_16660 [Mycolicibacterium conceptionense]
MVHYSDLRLPVSATTDSGGVINPDGMYGLYARSALSGSTAINSPSLPRDGHIIRFRFKDNGTARALNWNAIYRAIGVTLPTATVAGKTLYVTTIYNAADNKWDVIDVKQEA